MARDQQEVRRKLRILDNAAKSGHASHTLQGRGRKSSITSPGLTEPTMGKHLMSRLGKS